MCLSHYNHFSGIVFMDFCVMVGTCTVHVLVFYTVHNMINIVWKLYVQGCKFFVWNLPCVRYMYAHFMCSLYSQKHNGPS